MKPTSLAILAALALTFAGPGLAAPAAAPRPMLTLAGGVDVPGYTGDFDHFAVDEKGDRLFLAGEEGATIEVFRLSTGAHLTTLKDVQSPHSLLWMADRNELLVIDGAAKNASKILDGTTFALKRRLALPTAGANSIGYDPVTRRLWVVSGGHDVPLDNCDVIEVDPVSGTIFSRTRIGANHVEGVAIERSGARLFVNVTATGEVAVIDKVKGGIVARWPIGAAQQNGPIALDDKTHRLFVVTRKPGLLLVLDAANGARVARFKAPEHADQAVWDAANRRIYVTGGDGHIGVVQQEDADHYRLLPDIPSSPGGKTAVLVPSLRRLYVAVSPGDTKTMARLIWFNVGSKH